MKKTEPTFVYICRAGENEELRYSIRSVVASFPNAKIWVVGEPPTWYDGDYIKVKQDSPKYISAYKNLMTIAMSPLLPENIVIMNDDFYIVKKVSKIEYFNEGLLEEKYNLYFDYYPRSEYTRRIDETIRKLKKLNFANPISYELHVPFPVEKSKLAKVVKNEKYLWRSMYGNIYEVGGKEMSDVKVYKNSNKFKFYNYKSEKYPYLSTDDASFDMVLNDKLMKQFNKKTKYEKH